MKRLLFVLGALLLIASSCSDLVQYSVCYRAKGDTTAATITYMNNYDEATVVTIDADHPLPWLWSTLRPSNPGTYTISATNAGTGELKLEIYKDGDLKETESITGLGSISATMIVD